MKTVRFLSAQIWTIAQASSGNAVFIRSEGSGVALPVYVSESDIQNILIEMTHILAPRPMIHELLISTITALDAKLERVEIYGIKGGSYLCRIVIVKNGKEIRLESRPSDILCLSARMECPVHVDDEVMAKNAVPVDRISSVQETGESSLQENSMRQLLQKELQQALDIEDYERAANLRDRLKAVDAAESGAAGRI